MTATATDVVAELRSWLEANWDPDLTVGEWWERLGLAGWSAPSLPEHAYGRDLERADATRVQQEIGRFGALGPPGGLGLLLAAPTIAAHGTQAQIDRYVRGIVTGQDGWCQLFSEPGAGSDLAGLQARAVRDGDEFVVNGQKVWTSNGQFADFGMLIVRTDPDVPKHEGISYFAFDMHQPGVEVRPLKEMTGRALFNEVFMTDARVREAAMIGYLNRGWAVANTTLMHERAGLGGGGMAAVGGAALPGSVAGHLGMRAGDFVSGGRSGGGMAGAAGAAGMFRGGAQMMAAMAAASGRSGDKALRQEIARFYTLGEVNRLNTLRAKAAKEQGGDLPGLPNISKLLMSEIVRTTRDLGLRILGPYGTLHGYTSADRKVLEAATGNPFSRFITEAALFAQAPSIYGGTDQIQRNIIAERVLGLPKDPPLL